MTESRLHRVGQGECLASLACNAGMPRDRIWEDAANEQLRKNRDPFLLNPCDRIAIPGLDSGEESCETEVRHRFRRLVEPTKLRIRMLEDGEPRADVPWTLLDNNSSIAEGVTSSEGVLETEIDPRLMELTLQFGPEDKLEQFDLQLGSLDPVETVSGVQGRLANLGYRSGPIDGITGPLTKAAVRNFQKHVGATVDGIVGPETVRYLKNEYGC